MGKSKGYIATTDILAIKAGYSLSAGYDVPKWIKFCYHFLNNGYRVRVYEAQRTVSKYVTIIGNGKSFKVRFSNHKPIKDRELNGDCDFFVGVTHTGVRTTGMAIKAAEDFFK